MSGQETSPQSPPANTPKHRRPWTSAEDATLRTLVGHFGASRGSEGRWKDIAAGLEGRTAKVSRRLRTRLNAIIGLHDARSLAEEMAVS
jgi:Myb-like DNA-binding protein BAS1